MGLIKTSNSVHSTRYYRSIGFATQSLPFHSHRNMNEKKELSVISIGGAVIVIIVVLWFFVHRVQ